MYPPSMVRVSSSDEVRVDQIVRRNRTQGMSGTSGYVTLTSGEKVEVTAEYMDTVWDAIDTYLARWETVRAIVVAMPEGSAPQNAQPTRKQAFDQALRRELLDIGEPIQTD